MTVSREDFTPIQIQYNLYSHLRKMSRETPSLLEVFFLIIVRIDGASLQFLYKTDIIDIIYSFPKITSLQGASPIDPISRENTFPLKNPFIFFPHFHYEIHSEKIRNRYVIISEKLLVKILTGTFSLYFYLFPRGKETA